LSSTRPGPGPIEGEAETKPKAEAASSAERAEPVTFTPEPESEGASLGDPLGPRVHPTPIGPDGDIVARFGLVSVSSDPEKIEPSKVEQPSEDVEKPRPFQSLLDLLHDLAIAVVVCIVLITYVVQAFKVQGTSMSPELKDGERILVNKLVYRIGDIARGDVVVFWYPEDPELSFIKRVVGLPGETVEIVNGRVHIDGKVIDEAYVSSQNADRRSHPSQVVRPGHYFVLGDNRGGSNDSRSWGFVPGRYIYGKAFVRLWPLGEVGIVE
jgi:signal peptidase I